MMKRFLIMIMIALLLLSVAGCKEESAKPTDKSSDSSDDTSAAEDGAEASAEKGSESGLGDKFTDFVTKRAAGLKYTITYDVSANAQGQSHKYTMTQYFGGTSKFRFDMTQMANAPETRMYAVGKTYTSCSKQAAEWQCFKTEGDQAQNPNAQFDDVYKAPEDYDVSYAGTMSVAGVTAQCFKVAMQETEVKTCFSKEGVPLYMKAGATGMETEMKATSYKASVKDSDFVPPVEPMDVNAMMAKYQTAQDD